MILYRNSSQPDKPCSGRWYYS